MTARVLLTCRMIDVHGNLNRKRLRKFRDELDCIFTDAMTVKKLTFVQTQCLL